MITALVLCAGLAFLYFGAEWLVKGSSNLASRAGIPSLIVGLTIVSFGTSAPELAVSIKAGLNGLGDIAVGNNVGSNIFNIAVILGLAAMIHPLKVHVQLLRIDTPIVVGVSILIWFFLRDNQISRLEGAVLTVGIILYILFTIYMGKKNSSLLVQSDSTKDDFQPKRPLIIDLILIALGLGTLVAGSQLFVSGAIELARTLHVSEAIIGLTIVAAGTSLPELATSVIAAIKGEEDIAIGNIIGSNLFNMLGILGISSMLTPLHSQGIGIVDLAFMTGTAALLLPFMSTGFRINRVEGGVLLSMYIGYMWYLWP